MAVSADSVALSVAVGVEVTAELKTLPEPVKPALLAPTGGSGSKCKFDSLQCGQTHSRDL